MSDTSHTRTSTSARTELERLAWPEMPPNVLKILEKHGTVRQVEAGDVIWEVGQSGYPFGYLYDAEMNVVDRGNADAVVVTLTAGNLVGELGMLMGQQTFFAGVAATSGRILLVEPDVLKHLVATVPEVSDVVVSAYAARRKLLIEWADGALTIIGDDNDRTCLGLREYASRNRIPFRFIDRTDSTSIDAYAAGRELPHHGTVAVAAGGTVLHNPDRQTLAQALGYQLAPSMDELFDVAVVGAGPGGLAASVYGASEGLNTIAIDDTAIGGQAGTSSRIENYLGFPTGISGSELAYLGEIQAIKFGARIAVPHRASALRKTGIHFEIDLDENGECIRTRAVIIASGARYRKLPLSNVTDYEGKGIYYAATELEARYAAGTNAVIVGGGNSAGQAAMFLSRHADHTYIVVRRDGLAATMSDYLTSRILQDPRITLVTHSEVTELRGAGGLQSLTLTNQKTGEANDVDCRALYVMIGASPNAGWASNLIKTDDKGFILTGHDAGNDSSPFATSEPGVFAVGDVRSGSVKRVASAVGEGSVVVAAVHQFLSSLDELSTG